MSERRGWAGLVFAVALFGAAAPVVTVSAAPAATLRLINRDDPGEGFNDPTPATPVGGNNGTTIGEQRLIAFQRAIDLWATLLDSGVEIRISASFDDLGCNATSVTLGMAGPVSVFRDFAGAPLANTYYPSALADRLAGTDLVPEEDDIEAMFNSRFGNGCAFPAGWYYGLDASPPGNNSDMVTVVLHELGHGLGFLSLVNVNTGARFDGRDDVFLAFLLDDRSETALSNMTNAQRRSAIAATAHLKWFGAQVIAASDRLIFGADDQGRVEMYAPDSPIEGSSVSHWSDDLEANELMEPFFTQALHDVGLAAEGLADLGWSAEPFCPADCDDSRQVTINELISAVRIALGDLPVAACTAADVDNSADVTVAELVGAVGRALDGCDAGEA